MRNLTVVVLLAAALLAGCGPTDPNAQPSEGGALPVPAPDHGPIPPAKPPLEPPGGMPEGASMVSFRALLYDKDGAELVGEVSVTVRNFGPDPVIVDPATGTALPGEGGIAEDYLPRFPGGVWYNDVLMPGMVGADFEATTVVGLPQGGKIRCEAWRGGTMVSGVDFLQLADDGRPVSVLCLYGARG